LLLRGNRSRVRLKEFLHHLPVSWHQELIVCKYKIVDITPRMDDSSMVFLVKISNDF
jgi:hypothetical protein